MTRWALVAFAVAAAALAALAARALLAVPAGGHVTGSGVAARLVVPSDVRAERAAETAFAHAPRSGPPALVLKQRVQLESALSRIEGGSGRRSVRSRAATLLGLLALDDARTDPTGAQRYATEARERLRDAIRLDSANGAAAFDLELLLTAKTPHGGRVNRGNGAPPATGRAGAQPPGSGY